jgi:hypothetical protein
MIDILILPDEIFNKIFSVFISNLHVLIRLRSVCRKFYNITNKYLLNRFDVVIESVDTDNYRGLVCLFNDYSVYYTVITDEDNIYTRQIIYGIPFVTDLNIHGYGNYQLIYRRYRSMGKLCLTMLSEYYTIINKPSKSNVYIYSIKESYPHNIKLEIDLYNSYYILHNGYKRLKLLYILKSKYRHYIQHSNVMLELVKFAIYLYYNARIFRLKIKDEYGDIIPDNLLECTVFDKSGITENYHQNEFDTDPNVISAEECEKYYTNLIKVIYPKLKHAIRNYYF